MSRRLAIRERSIGDAEELDYTPIEIPDQRPLSLRDEMKRYIRTVMSEYAQQQDMGTFEDEDDFTEEDPDPDWTSPYEVQDMHEDPQLGPGYTLEPSDKESPTVSPAAADAPGTGSPNEPTPASAGKPEQD